MRYTFTKKRVVFLLIVMLAAITAVSLAIRTGYLTRSAAAAQPRVINEGEEGGRGEIRQLLTERRETLGEILKTVERYYGAGTVDIEEVWNAKTAWLRAGLELTSLREERISILESIVKVEKERENTLAKMHQTGRATQVDASRAKVSRLEAEIELARERLAGQSEEK